MITVTIDGRTVEVEPGTLIVEAAKRVGIHIPTYCYHPKLDPAGLCRICLVEVEKMPKLQTACSTPVSEGMVVHTDTPAVAEARRGVMEFLLLNHPLDCPICDKGGECDLQNYSYRYGSPLSRLQDAKEHKRKAAILGPFIVLDEERCILCRRCVRFDTEVAREGTLTVFDRGTHSVIGTADGSPYVSYFSGNTIELCPVGALTSRLYRFRARPWDLERTPVVCHHCPVGCNLEAHTRQGRLERLVVRENPATDGGWLCDRGRFGYRYAQEGPRLRQPLLRRDGELVPVTWQEAAVEAVRRLGEARGRTAVLGGARLTNEEAYLLQKFARAVLATHDVDWRLAGEALAAPPRHLAARMTDVDRAGALVLAGVLPAEEAPVLDLRLRRAAARRGAAVLSVGPLRPTYEGLHRHLACPPAELAARLEALAAAVRGRPAPDWATEAVTSLARDPVVLLVTGRDRAAAAAALDLAAALRERDREAGVLVLNAQANARGAEAMGLLPWLLPGYRPVADATARAELEAAWRRPLPATPGRNAAAALAAAAAGEVAALYVVAANPAVTFPDAALWQAAVRSGAFLVVQELFLTETARAADLVLPAASPFEKAGHYTSLDGLAQESRAPLPPVEGALPDGVILEGLARGLGYRRLRPSDQELAWAVQAVPLEPEAPAWDPTGDAPRPTGMLDVGGRRLAVVGVPRLYAGEGTAAADPGLAGVRPAPFLLLHPEDAAAAGLADGDEVEVETDLGNAALRVQVSDALVPGAAGVGERLGRLPHPWVAAGGAVRVRAEAGAGR